MAGHHFGGQEGIVRVFRDGGRWKGIKRGQSAFFLRKRGTVP